MIEINKFSYYESLSESIFFTKTDNIQVSLRRISQAKSPLILISGNSDYPASHIKHLVPKNVIYWLCQNNDTGLDWTEGLPIGFENSVPNFLGHDQGKVWPRAFYHKKLLRYYAQNSFRHTKLIYANFGLGTNQSREEVANICLGLPYVTCKFSHTSFSNENYNYESYLQEILNHKFLVCPHGNGYDCHRIWEAIYLGRIPIVQKSAISDMYLNLPIILVDDWYQIRDLLFLENQYFKAIQKKALMLPNISSQLWWLNHIIAISAGIQGGAIASREEIAKFLSDLF